MVDISFDMASVILTVKGAVFYFEDPIKKATFLAFYPEHQGANI
jgi:hypothetical protein